MDANDGALFSQPQSADGQVGAAGHSHSDGASRLAERSARMNSQYSAGLKRGAERLLESAAPKKLATMSRTIPGNGYRAPVPHSRRIQNSTVAPGSQMHHQSISDVLHHTTQVQTPVTFSHRHEWSEVGYGGPAGEEQHQRRPDALQQRPQSSIDTTLDTQFPIQDNWATFQQAPSVDYSYDATLGPPQETASFNDFVGRESQVDHHATPWTLASGLEAYQAPFKPTQDCGEAQFWNPAQLNGQADLSDGDILPARPFSESTSQSQESCRQQSEPSKTSSFDAAIELSQRRTYSQQSFMTTPSYVSHHGYVPQPSIPSQQSSQGQANFLPIQTSTQHPIFRPNHKTASNGTTAHITRMPLLGPNPTPYTTILAGDTAYYLGTFTPFPVPNDDNIAAIKSNGPHHVQRIFDAISHLPPNVNAAQESGVKIYTRYIEEKMVKNNVDPNFRHSRVAGRIFSAAIQLHEFQGHILEADELASHTVIKGKEVVKTIRKQDKELNLLARLDVIVDTLSLYKLIVKDCVLSERSIMLCVKEPHMYIALKEQSKSSNGGRGGRN